MERTHTDILKGLVSAGKRWRYGEKADNLVTRRIVWELKHIIDVGFVDYYVMAFWIFKYSMQDINYWARGAVSSSVVCYCLGLTEADPLRYRLHAERFVNEDPPKFQFDIELLRFDEFKERVEEVFSANKEDFDVESMRDCFIYNLWDSITLSTEREREMPEDIEGEITLYALWYGGRHDLFDEYFLRKEGEIWKITGIYQLDNILDSTFGLLIYQEQMLDILQQFFYVSPIDSNRIRIAIQKNETEQVETYRKELFANLRNISIEEAQKVWKVLISNPYAYLKAHAVSRVVQSYDYNMPSINNSYWVRHRINYLKKNVTKREEIYPLKDKVIGLWG